MLLPFVAEAAILRSYGQAMKWLTTVVPMRSPAVFDGPDATTTLCEHIAEAGVERLLVVTDADLRGLGLLDPILENLERLGIELTLYDHITPDPTTEQIDEGARLLRERDCDAVLAVGGGSPIDAAKVISACATNHKQVRELAGMFRVRRRPKRIFAIPTTAGTGSEVTVAAVVTDSDDQRKLPVVDGKLVPHAVALDGTLTLGLPPRLTAATGMDVLTHAIEAYLSRAANRRTRQYAASAARRTFAYLPRAHEDGGKDLEARQQMLLASHEAGRAINQASAGYVHAIAHQIGARYHTPHGLANATILPSVLAHSRPQIDPQLAELALYCGLSAPGPGDTALADRLLEHITQLCRRLAIPVALDGLLVDDIPALAKGALREARMLYAVPRLMRTRDCERLLSGLLPA
ncbi:iron-containing alcohol dehydrogenase [uncultured Abyssibacter sp.]|uniref:iron-containing alcohol dehydrogenase n=1 Tax=uncultured Abyssibacter sp. TaxID=2320202 RepID=UPI0032B22FDA